MFTTNAGGSPAIAHSGQDERVRHTPWLLLNPKTTAVQKLGAALTTKSINLPCKTNASKRRGFAQISPYTPGTCGFEAKHTTGTN